MYQPPDDCPIPGAEGFCAPEGTGANGVLVLGEALGEAEAHDGLPFRPHAPAGALLERAIRRAGYSRSQFVLWNAVPTRPPKNWLEGAPWEHQAVAWGRPYLEKVIHAYKPRCILALGGVALRAASGLCGEYRSISHLRGYCLDSSFGIPVVGAFHPSFLRRGAMPLFPVLMHDLKLAVCVASLAPGQTGKFFSPVLWRDFTYTRPLTNFDMDYPEIPPGYLTHPTESEAWEFLRQAEQEPTCPLAYDIETPRSTETSEDESDELADVDILSVQFSLGRGSGIFMPYRDPFVGIARAALRGENPKIGANTWRFDDPLLEAHGFQLGGKRHDVRWCWHHLQPDMKAALQFIASFYACELGPWKHLHQSHKEVYGIRDVDVLQRIWTDAPLQSISQPKHSIGVQMRPLQEVAHSLAEGGMERTA